MICDMKAMREKVNLPALKIALIYCLFAGLWIVFSDRVIDSIAIGKAAISSMQTMKGLFFVVITTLLVFVLVNRSFKLEKCLFNKLVMSESRFRALFEHAEISIWNKDLTEVVRSLEQLRTEGITDLRKHLADNPQIARDIAGSVKVIHVNEATLKLFGARSKEQFLSRIDTTFGPNAMEVFIEELCAIWEGKSTFRAEAVFLTFDGREITCIVSFNIPTTVEEFASIPVSIINISEQKNLENKLRASKQQFEQFMKNIPANILIKDEKRRIIYANHSASAFFGKENIVGLDVYDL